MKKKVLTKSEMRTISGGSYNSDTGGSDDAERETRRERQESNPPPPPPHCGAGCHSDR